MITQADKKRLQEKMQELKPLECPKCQSRDFQRPKLLAGDYVCLSCKHIISPHGKANGFVWAR